MINSIGGGAIWVYSRDTNAYRRLVNVAGGGIASWLNDGRRFIYGNGGRLFVGDAVSGSNRELVAIPGESIGYPRVTADNSQLFYLRGTSDGDIWTVRFDQK